MQCNTEGKVEVDEECLFHNFSLKLGPQKCFVTVVWTEQIPVIICFCVLLCSRHVCLNSSHMFGWCVWSHMCGSMYMFTCISWVCTYTCIVWRFVSGVFLDSTLPSKTCPHCIHSPIPSSNECAKSSVFQFPRDVCEPNSTGRIAERNTIFTWTLSPDF